MFAATSGAWPGRVIADSPLRIVEQSLNESGFRAAAEPNVREFPVAKALRVGLRYHAEDEVRLFQLPRSTMASPHRCPCKRRAGNHSRRGKGSRAVPNPLAMLIGVVAIADENARGTHRP